MDEKNLELACQQIQMLIDEANTVAQYSRNLAQLELAGRVGEVDTLKEIIGDELNHIIRFFNGYCEITGLAPKED